MAFIAAKRTLRPRTDERMVQLPFEWEFRKTTTMNRSPDHTRWLATYLRNSLHFADDTGFLTNATSHHYASGDKVCRECAVKKRNEMRVKRLRRTFKVTFHPFEPFCQLKRLCEPNLWPAGDEWLWRPVVQDRCNGNVLGSRSCAAHPFRVFGDFFESFLSYLIWCLRPT